MWTSTAKGVSAKSIGLVLLPLLLLLAVLAVPAKADTGDELPVQIELSTSSTDEIGGSVSVSEPSSSAEESTSTPESSDPAIADSSSVPPDGAGDTSTSVPEESSSIPDELPLESEALPESSEPEATEPTEPPQTADSYQQMLLFSSGVISGVMLVNILLNRV